MEKFIKKSFSGFVNFLKECEKAVEEGRATFEQKYFYEHIFEVQERGGSSIETLAEALESLGLFD